MTNETIQSPTAAVFAAFIEADSALKELPKVRADLDAAHDLLTETSAKLDSEKSKTELLQATLDQLRAELASKEAALSAATFRGDKATALLDGLRGLLGGGGDRGSDTVAPVSAKTETETQAPSATANPKEAADEAHVTDAKPQGQRDSDPTLEQPSISTTGGKAIPQSSKLGNESASPTNPTEVANSATPNAIPPLDIQRDTLTVSSGPAASTATPMTQADASSGSDAKAALKPWTAKPYWVTWTDWANPALHNGEVPEWVTDRNAV